MEATSAVLLVFGLAVLLMSWITLMITSWKEDYAWGLFSLLLPPVAYCYALFRLDKAGQSVLLAFLGCALVLFAL